jgi:type I restriction enzyme S subunit
MNMRVKLSEICEIKAGGTPSRSNQKYWINGTIPWVKIRDIDGKYLSKTEELITEEGLNNSSTKYISKGSILFTIFATLGEVCILDIDATTNQAIAGITINDNKIERDYLYYYLRSLKSHVNNIGRGVAQNNINLSILRDFEVPLVRIEEQRKISNSLDTVSKIIELRKKQLEDFENLIKSRFVEMFGDLAINPFMWKESQLIDLCSHKDDIKCGPFGTQLSKDEYQKEGVPLWGIPQINSFFAIMPTDYLSEGKAKKLESYSIIKGDIVMSRKGNVGKCAIYPDDLPIGIMHSDALRIRINPEEINSKFLMHQLHNSRYVVNQIENISSGAIMAGVNVTKLKTIFVHLPPIDLQNQFAVFVQQVDKLKFELNKSLSELEDNFNSLMQKAFKGELFSE